MAESMLVLTGATLLRVVLARLALLSPVRISMINGAFLVLAPRRAVTAAFFDCPVVSASGLTMAFAKFSLFLFIALFSIGTSLRE
ncbi:hypothetical protein D3C85_1575550 [compost metagenome]